MKQQTIEKEPLKFCELKNMREVPEGIKVRLSTVLMLFITVLSFGQLTKSENYIDRKECLNGDCSQYSEAVTYFDGLGRMKQIIGVKASPGGKDVVSHIEYDQFGRPVKNYLPIPQDLTQSGGIYTAPLLAASTTYGVEKIYSESVLENSPLGRIQKQIKLGQDWNNKPVNYSYATNTSLDKVRKFTTITSWENGSTKSDLVENGIYSDGKLYKTTVTDEDGMPTTEFKNSKGQIILSRKGDNNDTYYVYNEYDQIAFVLPPLAGIATDIVVNKIKQEELLYQYRYDKKYHLVEKKMPGTAWEFIVYDKTGKVVLYQNGLLGSITNNFGKKGWRFTKYDQLGRIAYTGFFANNSTRADMQTAINGMTANPGNNELRSDTSFTLNGLDIYYTKNAFPKGSMTILSVNYYDTYPPGAPSVPSQILGKSVLQQPGAGNISVASTKGLPLASYVKNIDDDRWTKDYNYYDIKGRGISVISVNYLGGYSQMEAELDFIGNPLRINTYHKRKSDEVGVNVKERFVYDDQKRVKQHYHQVDDLPEELLSDNTYNELSQLVNKKVGNNLQSIDYAYNIKGWLTDINKNQMNIPDLGGKLFSYRVKYNQKDGITNPDGVLFAGKNVVAKYNGNIAEVDWRSVEIPGVNPSITPKRYGYAYDNLNRLSAGFYQNPLNPYSKENTESIQYDLNGNITNLYRTSVMDNASSIATKIDDLAYTYSGNKAISIKDNSLNPTGYEGVNGLPIEYDVNGNITSMPDKAIFNVKYNYLNLPKALDLLSDTFGKHIETMYRADGSKLKKTSIGSVAGYNTITTTTESLDYLDGFEYYKKDITTSGGNGSGTPILEDDFSTSTARAMEPMAFSPIMVDPVLGNGTIINNTLQAVKTADLQFFPTSEGFYDYQKNQYIYQYRDIYGNARVSFGKNSVGVLEIVDNNDYYPYGMNHLKTGISYFAQNSYKRYKFLGNELQETGIYNMNARFYMPDVGRFAQHDPLSDSTLDPYGYAFGNPINFIDPFGTSPVDWNETGTEFGQGGPGNPQTIGTTANPIDVGEIVLNAPIRPMTFNSNLPSCSYCYTGSGVKGGLQNMGILPRPLSDEEIFKIISKPVLHNGSALMMDSMWEVLGIVAANAKPENQEAALGLAAIAVITTKGKAAPAILKAEAGIAKGESRAIVNLTEETFSQALMKGAENVGGYSIYGTKGLVGNTFNRNIFLLEASGNKSLSGFRSLVGSMEKEALGAGASKISIYGSSVINKGFLNPNIAARFGYSFEQSGSGVILQKTLK